MLAHSASVSVSNYFPVTFNFHIYNLKVTSIRLTEPVKEFPQSWHVSVSFFFIGYEYVLACNLIVEKPRLCCLLFKTQHRFLLKKHLLYYMYANSLKYFW